MSTPPLLQGKKGAIFGVANKRSIAWGITQAAAAAGAQLALNYQNERLKSSIEELAKELPGAILAPCDVSDDTQIKSFFEQVRGTFGKLDFLVHSLAFAKKEDLEGEFINTSRDGYILAQNVSSFSLTALAREAAPLMAGGGSIITLTYMGSERVIPHYNVMGVAKAALESSLRYLTYDLGPKQIRVNAISAGPINTLAARGISGFSDMLKYVSEKAPLRRGTEVGEVADTALFLLSDLSRGVTGNIIYVDSGYHVMGM